MVRIIRPELVAVLFDSLATQLNATATASNTANQPSFLESLGIYMQVAVTAIEHMDRIVDWEAVEDTPGNFAFDELTYADNSSIHNDITCLIFEAGKSLLDATEVDAAMWMRNALITADIPVIPLEKLQP